MGTHASAVVRLAILGLPVSRAYSAPAGLSAREQCDGDVRMKHRVDGRDQVSASSRPVSPPRASESDAVSQKGRSATEPDCVPGPCRCRCPLVLDGCALDPTPRRFACEAPGGSSSARISPAVHAGQLERRCVPIILPPDDPGPARNVLRPHSVQTRKPCRARCRRSDPPWAVMPLSVG